MDPTTVCCPTMDCPARGPRGQGHLGVHSRKDRRFMGTQGHKTFAGTSGTVFSRVRTAAEWVVTVVTWRAHGCPWPALVAACGRDERTVADGWARAGQQGHAIQAYVVEPPRDLGRMDGCRLPPHPPSRHFLSRLKGGQGDFAHACTRGCTNVMGFDLERL